MTNQLRVRRRGGGGGEVKVQYSTTAAAIINVSLLRYCNEVTRLAIQGTILRHYLSNLHLINLRSSLLLLLLLRGRCLGEIVLCFPLRPSVLSAFWPCVLGGAGSCQLRKRRTAVGEKIGRPRLPGMLILLACVRSNHKQLFESILVSLLSTSTVNLLSSTLRVRVHIHACSSNREILPIHFNQSQNHVILQVRVLVLVLVP